MIFIVIPCVAESDVLPPQEVVPPSRAINKGIVIKLLTGVHFVSLRKCLVIKLKLRWFNCGPPR